MMSEGTIKTVCSVIENKWHYKGNIIYANDQKIVIRGIYSCEIILSSIRNCYCKSHIIFSDIHLIIDGVNNKEELILRISNSKKAKAIMQEISKNQRAVYRENRKE